MSYDRETERSLAMSEHMRERVKQGLPNDPNFELNLDIEELKKAELTGNVAKFRDDFLRVIQGETIPVDLHQIRGMDVYQRSTVMRLMSYFQRA